MCACDLHGSKVKLLFRDLDRQSVVGQARRTDEYDEFARLDDVLLVGAPVSELFVTETERKLALLTRRIGLLHEALQLADRTGDLCDAVVNVALRCLLAGNIARVLYANLDLKLVAVLDLGE